MVRAGGLKRFVNCAALAHDLDMEPQSLYTYFPSKQRGLRPPLCGRQPGAPDRFPADSETSDDPRHVLRQIAHLFVSFAADDPARYELLFMRTVPIRAIAEFLALALTSFSQARSPLADSWARR